MENKYLSYDDNKIMDNIISGNEINKREYLILLKELLYFMTVMGDVFEYKEDEVFWNIHDIIEEKIKELALT